MGPILFKRVRINIKIQKFHRKSQACGLFEKPELLAVLVLWWLRATWVQPHLKMQMDPGLLRFSLSASCRFSDSAHLTPCRHFTLRSFFESFSQFQAKHFYLIAVKCWNLLIINLKQTKETVFRAIPIFTWHNSFHLLSNRGKSRCSHNHD